MIDPDDVIPWVILLCAVSVLVIACAVAVRVVVGC